MTFEFNYVFYVSAVNFLLNLQFTNSFKQFFASLIMESILAFDGRKRGIFGVDCFVRQLFVQEYPLKKVADLKWMQNKLIHQSSAARYS